ncbi:MAG: protoporphyrinogen oxidase [Thermincolia bacterium]
MKKVIVIGGGMTGLAAAYTLEEKAKGKVDYLLIEQENRLGGKIHTVQEDGFILEGGPDCFLSEKPQVAQLSEKIGIEDRLLPSHEASKGSSVFTGGKLHKLPEGLMLMVPTKILPFAFSSLISWPGKIRMAMDLIIPRRKDNQDESLGSFVTRRLGQEALDKIAEPLIGGIHSGDPEQMSLKASFPRFLQMEEKYGSLIRAMLSARKNVPQNPQPSSAKVEKTYFMSFKGGMGELTDTVVGKLDKSKLLLGKTVTGVKKKDGKYLVSIEGMETQEADAIIVATPANVAADILREVDDVITGKLQQIPFVSSATVSLAFRRADIKVDLNSFGFVIPRKENRKIMAVTYSSTKWHNHRTPGDDYVLVRAFVGGPSNQQLVTVDDEKMLKMVQSEVKEIMGIDAKPVRTKIFRWVKGMPQYTIGHLDRMEDIEKQLTKHPGLYIVGGSYRGVGISNCIGEGSGAAEKALQHLA